MSTTVIIRSGAGDRAGESHWCVGDLRRTQYGCVLDDPDESEAPQLRGQDVIAVRKVFSLLEEEVRTAKGRLQVIVLDHAGEDV
jgi:Protein of unknown function (DUF3732)